MAPVLTITGDPRAGSATSRRRLLVVGENDHTVIALWLENIAGRIVEDLVLSQPCQEIVAIEDARVERARIVPDIRSRW